MDEVTKLNELLKRKDENTIVDFTLGLTNAQRVEIRQKYQAQFQQDLLKDIDKYMSGDLLKTLQELYKDPIELDADLLYKAMKGFGSNKEVISEIACFRSLDRLNKVKEKFKEKYNKDLMNEINDETSGDLRTIVMKLMTEERGTNENPDFETCKKIAIELYNAGTKKIGTNSNSFIKYFTTLSAKELQLVAKEHHRIYKRNILELIDGEFSSNDNELLKMILYSLLSPSEYFARQIKKAVDGIGTDDDKLIRCIVTRADIDMKMIKKYYKQLFNVEMIVDVEDDTSGNYFKLLKGLIEKN